MIKHNTILLIILLVLLSFLAVYQIKYIKHDSKSTEEASVLTEKGAFDNKADTSQDSYQDGTFPGIVKSFSKDKEGNLIVEIDFVQLFTGNEAFLALIEDYELGKNITGNWDSFKSMYPTFNQLKSAVMKMTDEQFETFYYDVSSVERQKNEGAVPSGILGSFPNGFIYERNENSKVRTFKIAKDVKTMSIANSDATVSISELLKIKDLKNVTLTDGVVTSIEIIYKP